MVLTQVCGHLSLRDPTLDLASLSEPVTAVMENSAAEALRAKVTSLVEAFLQSTITAAEGETTGTAASGDACSVLFSERSASASRRRKNFA